MTSAVTIEGNILAVRCDQCECAPAEPFTRKALAEFVKAHRLHQERLLFQVELVAPSEHKGTRLAMHFYARGSDDWQRDPALQASTVEARRP